MCVRERVQHVQILIFQLPNGVVENSLEKRGLIVTVARVDVCAALFELAKDFILYAQYAAISIYKQ